MGTPSISSADFIRVLTSLGFKEKRQTSSHKQFTHHSPPRLVTVQYPIKDVTPGNLSCMLRQAGLTKKEFLKLLGSI
ncbi:MAG: type II toxin-antitoxin system HicA family toxin [Actinomycetota bacterium]